MTITEVCRQCHKNGTSCCATRTGHDNTMINPPVSEAEKEAILAHLRSKHQSEVFTEKPNDLFYIRQVQNLFPGMEQTVAERFPLDANHLELKTEDSICVLLGPNGCTLPKAIRPGFCRIYPFWFLEDSPHIFRDPDCLALATHQTVAEVFLSLGTTPENLKQIHEKLCLDLGFSPSRTQAELKSS